jgi:uroporphyrin-III C-methyltransferase/precorrin-2 dehydrogenase/sirohydrochlorin ferrochelatase
VENGAAPSLPAALIENGTRPDQRVLTGTLESIAGEAAAAGVKGPAILIIGSVVALRERLAWYVPDEEAQPRTDVATGEDTALPRSGPLELSGEAAAASAE